MLFFFDISQSNWELALHLYLVMIYVSKNILHCIFGLWAITPHTFLNVLLYFQVGSHLVNCICVLKSDPFHSKILVWSHICNCSSMMLFLCAAAGWKGDVFSVSAWPFHTRKYSDQYTVCSVSRLFLYFPHSISGCVFVLISSSLSPLYPSLCFKHIVTH